MFGIFIVVTALVTYCIHKFRATPNQSTPPPTYGNTRLEVGYTIFIILATIMVFAVHSMSASDPEGSQPDTGCCFSGELFPTPAFSSETRQTWAGSVTRHSAKNLIRHFLAWTSGLSEIAGHWHWNGNHRNQPDCDHIHNATSRTEHEAAGVGRILEDPEASQRA